MSFAFLPLYTGDYLRDTRDLSLTEHGIYLRLLMHSWDTRGPIPLDEDRACRIVGANSDDEVKSVRFILEAYFEKQDDGWHQDRLNREVAKANAISGARSVAGKLGAKKTWGKKKASAKANDKQMPRPEPLPPPPQPPLQPHPVQNLNDTVGLAPDDTPKINGKGHQTKAFNATAVALIKFLNDKTGSRYEPVQANVKLIVGRLREGFTEKQIRQVIANRCLAWANDPKMEEYLRPATLFNATKFANYAGQLGKVAPEPPHD